MSRLINITIEIIFFSINCKNDFDRSILVISMTVLLFSLIPYFSYPNKLPKKFSITIISMEISLILS